MTKEQRAQIARENGAKSKGPTSAAGKAKVSRNGIKTGDHTTTLSNFVPPDCALLCNEDRQAFFELMDSLIEAYQPANQEAISLVRQMAIARWQIERLNSCITMHWNVAVLNAGTQPLTVVAEIADIQIMTRASEAVNTGSAPVERINRQIDRLEMRITRLRRAIRDVNAHAPAPVEIFAPKIQTEPSGGLSTENKEVNSDPAPENAAAEPPIYTTERDPIVIAGYRREFPNRNIIVLPADDVANGVEIQDDMPVAPRRVV